MTDESRQFSDSTPDEGTLQNDIIELTDEDGNVESFEYLTTVEYEDNLYVVLMLLDDEEEDDDEEGEVIILRIEKDEQGEDMYVSVDDESVSDAVFQKFLQIVEEQGLEDDGEDE